MQTQTTRGREQVACSQRIAIFNENLTLHGGNSLDAFLLLGLDSSRVSLRAFQSSKQAACQRVSL